MPTVVDQSLLQSGFDIEVLLSPRYLRYALLAQVDAGLLPLDLDIVDADEGIDVHLTIHPPTDFTRRYTPHPAASLPEGVDGSFDTEVLIDDQSGANLLLTVVTDVFDRATGEQHEGIGIGLMLAVDIDATVDDRGFESNHELSITLVQFEPLTQLALAFAGLDVAEVTAQLKAQLDRRVPFGVAAGQSVQRVELRVVTGDNRPPALGALVNLALRNGNEADAFAPDRGDPMRARNFLGDGRDLAFGTSPGLWDRLADDLFFRMAEELPPDSGLFSHPLREIPGDPSSEVIGRLQGITIRPGVVDTTGTPTGVLEVVISGEYFLDLLPDPDFRLIITLRPVLTDGILTWDVDARVDVDLLASIAGFLLIALGALVFGPAVGVTLFALLLGADLITDAIASAATADRADELADASFLDALPTRIAVASRRWDPFYSTNHQVVTLLDEFQITPAGLAFDGVATLDREAEPTRHVVIRDEERDNSGAVSGLRYRVRDLETIAAGLDQVAPGTDRRPYRTVDAASDPRGENGLVAVTLDQVADRIGSGLLTAPVLCLPRRVHLVDNTINRLLVISKRESDEQRNALLTQFREITETAIRADQGADITQEETDRLRSELGRDPTDEELDGAVGERVDALVAVAEVDYVEGPFEPELDEAVATLLRFDLVPTEFASLQGAGVLAIAGKEIITMQNGTVYYRDRPDGFVGDNLLSLPHYSLPYEPA